MLTRITLAEQTTPTFRIRAHEHQSRRTPLLFRSLPTIYFRCIRSTTTSVNIISRSRIQSTVSPLETRLMLWSKYTSESSFGFSPVLCAQTTLLE